MHGLINRSIECFVRDMYGAEVWSDIAALGDFGSESFEAMLSYDDDVTDTLLRFACERLARPSDGFLEDLGTYLVTNSNSGAVRRLLRFGGESFTEFLHSLDDLQGRAKLAVPDLQIPSIDVREHGPRQFTLYCAVPHSGFAHVLVGVLRTMADDYGTLVFLEYLGANCGIHNISVQVHDVSFAMGNVFELGAGTD